MAVPATAETAGAAETAPTVLHLDQFRKSVALRVEVGGRERLFPFDTGGGISFLSPELAEELGCEKGARVVGFRMTGDRLEAPRCDNVRLAIEGHKFTAPVAGVYQVGEFNAAGVTVDGLIALDIFAGKTITFDFAGQRLIVETPESARLRQEQGTELAARMTSEAGAWGTGVYILVPSPMGPLAFQLDSGNGGTLLVAKPYAAAFGIDPDKGPRMGELDLGRGVRAEGLVIPADITLDGNLGMPFLKDYLVTLDLAQGRVWLAKNPVAPPPGMGTPPPLPASG
jgi:hypothetical protein